MSNLYQRIVGWEQGVRSVPVTPRMSRSEIREELAPLDFSRPRDLGELVNRVADLLEKGAVHPNHPRYFGLFNPGVRRAGIVADALAALYNPQVAGWWHAPAACEIEAHTLAHLGRKIGLDPSTSFATFTTGGSEANLTGVLCGLAHAFPGYAKGGVAAAGKAPVFYGSDQAHDSFVKIARTTGLGENAFRRVRSDARQRLDVDDLVAQIARDRADGKSPFLVVATVGTTATGAIDPVAALAALCKAEGLWLHADAAWGGLALLSETRRAHVADLALADSITWDAHKTFPVPMGAGMFFARTQSPSEAVFSVHTAYVPDAEPGTIDLYQRTIQWSRRFIGLKIFLTLAELGDAGMTKLVEHQMRMGVHLREALAGAGFRLTNDSPLPIACFTRDGNGLKPAEIARRMAAEGHAWLSEVRLGTGAHWLRACITHHDTGPEDIRQLVAAVQNITTM
ncbi:pyridoxal-dependent decarboxylase [Pendulispora rubella]|uniref:Pyridoxal-dependent decarboxylase n=1 Tax=Pendulispora rubella TaxID=2741070 RepID=A0ABZ2LDM0_9BACT